MAKLKSDLYTGDCVEVLKSLPEKSVHCVVTSPPYHGLRSYGGDPGMIGLEPTFEDHLINLVKVFQEVRRVLRDDGTLWLNYGDAYSGGGRGKGSTLEGTKQDTNEGSKGSVPVGFAATGLQSKNLMMMPSRVALALQADGWILRSEIIWAKPNPMPESVTDRPTSAHEKVYLFAKSQKYFYDAVAVRTRLKDPGDDRKGRAKSSHKSMPTGERNGIRPKQVPAGWASSENYKGQDPRYKKRKDPTYKKDKQRGHGRRHQGFNEKWDQMTKEEQQVGGANLRNVWHISTYNYKEAHFATFPPKLVEPCIKAGTSEMGCCADCGTPLVRQSIKNLIATENNTNFRQRGTKHVHGGDSAASHRHTTGHKPGLRNQYTTIDWKPSCECEAEIKPCVVMDPFGGSGTVGEVAAKHGRNSIIIEINDGYTDLAYKRIRKSKGVMLLDVNRKAAGDYSTPD